MDSESEIISLVSQIIPLLRSMDSDSQLEQKSELKCFITQIKSLLSPMDLSSKRKPESEFMSLIRQTISFASSLSGPELISFITQMISLFSSIDSDPKKEPELISLITQIFIVIGMENWESQGELRSKLLSLISEVIFLVKSLDLDSEPKSRIISLITQIISLASSISDQGPELEVISLVTQMISLISSIDLKKEPELESEFMSLIAEIFSRLNSMGSDSELISLISQIISLVNSSEAEQEQLISLSPRLKVEFVQGKFLVTRKVLLEGEEKRECDRRNMEACAIIIGEYTVHFRCPECNGQYHEEYEKAPVEIKHPLHQKHSLQLVWWEPSTNQTRKCYCCDDDLFEIFYYCSACDYAMNITCVDKQPLLVIYHPKWHEHTLALFPRRTSLTCNLCALADSSSPIYMCPSCDFVVHLRCINLPRVIRISRHLHRISFTRSFDQGDWSCNVCRREIDNDYGGYSCIKDGCSYTAHSRCATQSNLWDGIDLEGMEEEIEQEVSEPYVTISNGIIQHFSHDYEDHHLRLDENTEREYDKDKQCQACIMPIYYGNFYSCMHQAQCDFTLHETCANLSRKKHHPIHPHLLTLVAESVGERDTEFQCSACSWICTGFFYACGKRGCDFQLHVQCATTSEPLVHESHRRPLFLTSKPWDRRICCVCKDSKLEGTNETFNCIECDFSLCFKCATIPHRARYKYDKHMLTLSYGEETSTGTYWCEVCERKLIPKERFYRCGEYCCVTLHIECLLGKEFYMKPGLSLINYFGVKLKVLHNNHMSRPVCMICKKRCQQYVYSHRRGLVACSLGCVDLRQLV